MEPAARSAASPPRRPAEALPASPRPSGPPAAADPPSGGGGRGQPLGQHRRRPRGRPSAEPDPQPAAWAVRGEGSALRAQPSCSPHPPRGIQAAFGGPVGRWDSSGTGTSARRSAPGRWADRLSLQMQPGGPGRGRRQQRGLCAQRPSWHLGWETHPGPLGTCCLISPPSPGTLRTDAEMLLLLGQAGGGGEGGQKQWMFDRPKLVSLPSPFPRISSAQTLSVSSSTPGCLPSSRAPSKHPAPDIKCIKLSSPDPRPFTCTADQNTSKSTLSSNHSIPASHLHAQILFCYRLSCPRQEPKKSF